MAEQTYLSGLEFIHKVVVCNERDFSGIRLEEGFDFFKDQDSLGALKSYLRKHKALYYDPLNFSHSQFRHVNFNLKGAIITNVQADHADFSGSIFTSCYFGHSQFRDALFDDIQIKINPSANYSVNFTGCDFHSASLKRAYLQNGHFYQASFQGASFHFAQLANVYFGQADLCNARGLETTIGLDLAHFEKTKVNERERRIIELAKCGQMFEVMNSSTN